MGSCLYIWEYNKNVISLQHIYHIKIYFMNWNELRKKAIKYGFEFLEHGKKHDAYINRETGKIIRIERHWNQEVRSGLMNKLKKDIGF